MYIQFLTNESRVAYPFIFNTKKSFHLILIPLSVLEKSFLVKYLQKNSLSSLGWYISKRYSIWNVCLLYYLRICALRAFSFFFCLGYLFYSSLNKYLNGGESLLFFIIYYLLVWDIIFTILWLWIKRVDTWILIFSGIIEYESGCLV